MNTEDPRVLEQTAQSFLVSEKYLEAFGLYQQAANIYKRRKNHKQAAFCFAAAASCWSKKSGEKTFYNAALSYEAAAAQAEVSADLEYAAMLYKYATINYERDREFINFSDCFFRSKECYRRFLRYRLLNPKKIQPIMPTREQRGIKGACKCVLLWIGLELSNLIWGHGERPLRTISTGMLVVLLSAIAFTQGELMNNLSAFRPNFLEALYFSVITFTTVGYGDMTPLGLSKLVVTFEALCGIFIIPLFVIGLSRRYLRV
ncbi:ion channel [Candidatus Omnitrophota bacterium]